MSDFIFMEKKLNGFQQLPGSASSDANNHIEKKQIRRVLGIDPGLANTGFGVVDFCNGRYRMVSYGCITTDPNDSHELVL